MKTDGRTFRTLLLQQIMWLYIGFDTSVLAPNDSNGPSYIDADKLNRLTAILNEQREEYDQLVGNS